MLKRITPLLIFIFAIQATVNAQVTTSSMTGTILGSNNEPLAGATIVATHTPSGSRYSTTARAGGQFTIANMRVGGPYLIEISYVGFQTEKQDEIYLKLAETYLLSSTLKKLEGNLENVIITTNARRNPILNSGRTGAVTNIGRREIERLPSVTRNLNDLTRTTPQTSGGQSIGGGNYRQNNFTIDGADFNNSFGIGNNLPANGAPVSLDAIEEVSVSITPYDIRQSGFIGSSINAVTRAGTNKFTGSLYSFSRNQNQRGDKVEKTTFIRPAEDYTLYGIRLGGPIIKNKLFFFFNYETEIQPKTIQNRFASSPSAVFGSSPQIARPTRADLDMFSAYLSENYGYKTGAYDNYIEDITRKKILGRIDWNISQRHKMNIRYSQVEGGEPNPPSTSRSPLTGFTFGSGRTDINAMWYQNGNYFQGANFYSFAAELNSQLGKRLNNTFRGTYTFQNDSRTSKSAIFPFVDILSGGTPYASFGYEPFTFGNLRKVKMYSFVDNLSFTINKHAWTFGLQADFSETINGFQRFGTSYYTFASWADFASALDPNPANRVKPLDFAITYSLSPGFAQAFPSFKFRQYSLYGQDEISVNKKLKLTLGLRIDQPTYPKPLPTHPLVAALTFANGEKINTGVLPKQRLMWSPRLGFNWDMYGDRSFQIRGGTGIFTGKVPFVWIVSQAGDAGMLQVTQTFVGQANTPGPFNPDPNAYRPAVVPPAGTVIPSTISSMDPDFKNPQSWKTSIATDIKVGNGFIFTIEGIYNKDINTAFFRNPNLIAPQPLNVANYPDNRMIYGATVPTRFINPLTTAGLVSPTGTQAFNTIVLDNGNKGYYASLTLKLEKQFRGGFLGSVAYTKTVNSNLFDGNGDQPLSAWQGTANVSGSNFPVLGYAGFSVPDRLIAFVSYRKEYFKHLATTISLVYEGSIQGRYSYTYSSDFNRDGTNFDLIYIPKDPSEIEFVPITGAYNTLALSNVSGTYNNGIAYSAQQQSDLFFAFIEQDRYLRKHKGQYAERNGAQVPWRNQVDAKFVQDLFVNLGKNRNTLQFSVDIFNLGNLLNPSWGKLKTINASSILVPMNATSLTPGGALKPTFRLQVDRNNPLTSTFRDNVSTASTYFMQFGIRYLFN
jgi:hypothetical protein